MKNKKHDDLLYGQCVHGANMAACMRCKYGNHTYLYEYAGKKYPEFNGMWLTENGRSLTRNQDEAMKFSGSDAIAMAKLYLYLNQKRGIYKDLKIVEQRGT